MPSSYHHGDLPAALRQATAELVAERGPSGFSLREVARRAGVSHAAPAHHFGDARGLLTSLATEGMTILADALAEASANSTSATDRFEQAGRTYVATAIAHPGHFAVMFRNDLLNQNDSKCEAEGFRAYGELLDTVKAVRDELNPDLDVASAATLCWASMHGLVALSSTSAPGQPRAADEVGGLVDLMLTGLLPR